MRKALSLIHWILDEFGIEIHLWMFFLLEKFKKSKKKGACLRSGLSDAYEEQSNEL